MNVILDHSIESEQAVLGALLIDERAVDTVPEIRPEWFFLAAHQEIGKVILRLARDRKPTDAVMVHEALESEHKIPDPVPKDLVFALAKGLGAAANVAYYAGEVRRLWALRQARLLAARFASDIDLDSPESAIGALQRDLAAIEAGKGQARSISQLTIEYMIELERDMADPQARVAFDTGYTRYDKHTGGLRPGVLTVMAGRPGNGKTAFVMGILAHLARTGVPCAGFWLEDDWRDAVRRYFQARHYVRAEDLRGNPTRAAQALNDVVLRASEEQDRLWIDDTHGLTTSEIAARMRRLSREHGVRVFFADHLGEIRVERDDRWGERHDLALGRAARIYRDTAKELGAAPVLISQMNRQIERRGDATPRMADLDGSGQVEQAARVIAFLSQPRDDNGEPTGEFTVDLAKNTNGRPGVIKLRWVPERMTVENGSDA